MVEQGMFVPQKTSRWKMTRIRAASFFAILLTCAVAVAQLDHAVPPMQRLWDFVRGPQTVTLLTEEANRSLPLTAAAVEKANFLNESVLNQAGKAQRQKADRELLEAKNELSQAAKLVEMSDKPGAIESLKRAISLLADAKSAAEFAVGAGRKADGYITGFRADMRIGGEDKEVESHALVRVGGESLTLGGRDHWSDGHPASVERSNLRIPIQSTQNIFVGFGDEPNERNCATDATFSVKVFFEDDAGHRWDAQYVAPMRRYTTDGKGGNAEDVFLLKSVNRQEFEN